MVRASNIAELRKMTQQLMKMGLIRMNECKGGEWYRIYIVGIRRIDNKCSFMIIYGHEFNFMTGEEVGVPTSN